MTAKSILHPVIIPQTVHIQRFTNYEGTPINLDENIDNVTDGECVPPAPRRVRRAMNYRANNTPV